MYRTGNLLLPGKIILNQIGVRSPHGHAHVSNPCPHPLPHATAAPLPEAAPTKRPLYKQLQLRLSHLLV